MAKEKVQKLERKKREKRRGPPVRPVRFDVALNVKVEKPKKAALVRHAKKNQRSLSFMVQGMLDEFLQRYEIEVPTIEEADQILSEALNG